MATWNPINMFGKEDPTDGHWAGWIYAVDADTGVWKWRAKSNYPIRRRHHADGRWNRVLRLTSAAISMRWILPPARNSGEGRSEPAARSAAA